MKRFTKHILVVILGLIVLIGLGGAGSFIWLLGSLPLVDGQIHVTGITRDIEIVRDRHGIPHISAATDADALFGLGFVHAQDRLWQMEMNRRTGAGRLSEILGPAALSTDKFLRTLGVYRVAEQTLGAYEPAERAPLDAYSAGVNAYLDTHTGPLPLEFLILDHKPEPWRAEDSLVWMKMMAWDLGNNFHEELARARLSRQLSAHQISEFMPPYPGDAPHLIDDLPKLAKLYQAADVTRLAQALPETPPPGIGSNNWVVDGGRTLSGKPLLANDPHLGLSAPSVWYFAHLSVAGHDVIGATLPGVPAVVLGRNNQIAWGFTNTAPDVQDLYLEKIDAAKPDFYLTPTGLRRFSQRQEIIRVKDGADVQITVRESRHGPVISDAAELGLPPGMVMALTWTALLPGDRTLSSAANMMRAENWDEFVNGLRDYHLPQQNIVYADVDGNIGYYAPGKVPIRHKTNRLSGLAPAPGWEQVYDWIGFIPFEDLPQRYNPGGGVIVTANQKIVPDDYPHFITRGWAKPYRARRIRQLLGETKLHSVDSFKTVQSDVTSVVAGDVLPLMLSLTEDRFAPGSDTYTVRGQLEEWDRQMSVDRAEPLLFAAWYRELTRLIYADELKDLFPDMWKMRPQFIHNVLSGTDGQSRWCDDQNSDPVESCADQSTAALDKALVELRTRYGADMNKWQWGQAHMAYSAHRPFGKHPWLSKLFDLAIPSPGGSYTVNAGVYRICSQEPFHNTHSASMRAIYDLADPDKSLFIHSTGQSGNRLSPHYNNFVDPWRDGTYLSMTTDRQQILAHAMGTLILRPQRTELD